MNQGIIDQTVLLEVGTPKVLDEIWQ